MEPLPDNDSADFSMVHEMLFHETQHYIINTLTADVFQALWLDVFVAFAVVD